MSPGACGRRRGPGGGGRRGRGRRARGRAARAGGGRPRLRRAARPRARDDRMEDRLGGVILAAVDPAAAEREADLVLDPRVEGAARGGEPALGARASRQAARPASARASRPPCGGLAPVGPVGEQDRAVQVDESLVLRAASGVEAGERKREPRLRLERVVAARAGGGDGLAQAADPRVDRAGAERRLPASSCARACAPVLTSPGAGPGATARTPGPAASPSSRRSSASKASCWRSALWTSPAAAKRG